MAIITFWNNNTGKIGQTYSSFAIAMLMAVEHNHKTLLVSTSHNDTVTLKACGYDQMEKNINLITKKKNSMDLESGIEGISKLSLSNILTPDLIPNYTKVVLKQRFEFLTGPQDKEGENINYDRIYSSCKNILLMAKQFYDLVFVDLNHGLEEEATRDILNMSDIIILNIEQKLTEFDSVEELKKSLSNNKVLILINDYDRESKYNIKNVTKYLKEKKDILSVPHTSLFTEAMQEGTAIELFLNSKLRNLKDVDDKNAFFIKELRRDIDAIIYKMQELQMKV